jgi:hypothetical protein
MSRSTKSTVCDLIRSVRVLAAPWALARAHAHGVLAPAGETATRSTDNSRLRDAAGVLHGAIQPCVEGLESRLLYTVTTTLVNRHLEIVSDNAADVITVDHGFNTVFVNGKAEVSDFLIDQGGIQIRTGGGDDVVNILGAGQPVTIEGDSGNDTVFLGKHGNAQDIRKAVTVMNLNGNTGLVVDDSSDVVGQVIKMDVQGDTGTIAGLAPGLITYKASDIRSLQVKAGEGGNEIAIANTMSRPDLPIFLGTGLATGRGTDRVQLLKTTGALTIDMEGANPDLGDGIEFGDSTFPTEGSMHGIQGAVNVFSSGGQLFMSLHAGRDAEAHTVTVTNNSITGMSPAKITYSGLAGLARPVNLNMTTGDGADTFNVQSMTPTGPNGGQTFSIFAGAGSDTINVGNPQNKLDGLLSGMLLDGGEGIDVINIKDQGTTTAQTFTLDRLDFSTTNEGRVSRSGGARYVFRTENLNVNGGGGGNIFDVLDTVARNLPVNTTLNTGNGIDTVNVKGTTGAVTIEGQASNDKVNIGVGNTRNIKGAVNVRNFTGRTALNVDDSADTVARNVTLATSGANGTITGLSVSPAVINYVQDDLSSLTVSGPNPAIGAVGNTFTVADTFSSTAIGASMTLNSGNGGDTVNVQRTTAPLTVNGQNSRDVVNVGLNGSMQSIAGTLTVKNSFSFSTLNLNDQANAANHAVTMNVTNTGFADTGTITGLTPAPAQIKYTAADIGALNVNTGVGADTFTVNATHQNGAPASTTINSGAGIDTANVRGTLGPLSLKLGAGNDKVNVGSAVNTFDPIQGTVNVDGQGDADSLNVNDQGSTTTPHVYTTSSTTFTRTGAANVTFANVESPKLNKGLETTGAGSTPQVSKLIFPTSITLGQLATLSGKLIDPDASSTLKLIVNWGDGSKLDKTTPNQSAFTRTHKYAKTGKYTVRVTWIDQTGRSNRKDLILTVKK